MRPVANVRRVCKRRSFGKFLISDITQGGLWQFFSVCCNWFSAAHELVASETGLIPYLQLIERCCQNYTFHKRKYLDFLKYDCGYTGSQYRGFTTRNQAEKQINRFDWSQWMIVYIKYLQLKLLLQYCHWFFTRKLTGRIFTEWRKRLYTR